jgi:DinB superfamily
MTYQGINDIFAMIEKMNARFNSSISGLSEAQEKFRPALDRWTIAENVEHISIVNNGFLRLTYKLLKQAEADPKPAREDLQMPPLTLTVSGELKEGKMEAPETVRPKGDVPIAQSVIKNQQAIDDLFKLKPRLDPIDLSELNWPHPLLGQLNLYQWLLLLGEHVERHRLQIEGVKASAQFPGADVRC